MTGIADGGPGVWDLAGSDALRQATDYLRTVQILDADNLPSALDISWAVNIEAEIRLGTGPAAPLIATPVVTLETDGTDGRIVYRVSAAEIEPDSAVTTQAKHDVIGIDGSGNRYPLLVGRVHIRPTATVP